MFQWGEQFLLEAKEGDKAPASLVLDFGLAGEPSPEADGLGDTLPLEAGPDDLVGATSSTSLRL